MPCATRAFQVLCLLPTFAFLAAAGCLSTNTLRPFVLSEEPKPSGRLVFSMGILDRLRGGGANQRQDAAPSTSGREPSEVLGSDDVLQPAEAPDLYRGIPDVSSIPPGSAIGSLPSTPGSSQRLYNPYEGLESALDRRLNKGTYTLPDQPEFLFDEEATVHRRNWSENITYYTGSGYLGGNLGYYPMTPASCCCNSIF